MQWLSQGTMPLHFDEHHHNVHLTNRQEMVSSAVSAPTKDKFKPLAKQPDGMKEYGEVWEWESGQRMCKELQQVTQH
jgi:hypothetical protein